MQNFSRLWLAQICQIGSKHDKIKCDQKWNHILQYNHVGTYCVLDACRVAEFLEQLIITTPYLVPIVQPGMNFQKSFFSVTFDWDAVFTYLFLR